MNTSNQEKNDDRLKRTPLGSGKWIALLFVVLFVAVAAFAGTVMRGQGWFTGRATLTQSSGDLVELNINASGIVTHLGKCKVQLHTVADFSGPLPTPIPPSTGIITAANGDTITFTLKWTLREVSTGVFETVGPFTITGGTGRFNGAGGSGNYHGLVDTNTGEITSEITGEVVR